MLLSSSVVLSAAAVCLEAEWSNVTICDQVHLRLVKQCIVVFNMDTNNASSGSIEFIVVSMAHASLSLLHVTVPTSCPAACPVDGTITW